MKYFLFLLILTVLAFANNDGCTYIESGTGSHSAGSDDITLILINDWVLPEKALGLDIFIGTSSVYILGVDNMNDWIQAYDAATCTPLNKLYLDAANEHCFGMAWNNDATDETYYTNDCGGSNLFFTDDFGSTWSTYPNPSVTGSRGMDFDGTDYWITNGAGGGLWRFLPGAGQQNLAIPEVTGYPSGVTAFPYGGDICVAVTSYDEHYIFFYNWDGSSLTFIGSAPCPVSGTSASNSLGLAYSEANGNIYWSYRDLSDTYHITEFSFDLVSLEHTSWGAIKSSF